MQAIILFIVLFIIFNLLAEYEPTNKKIKRMDADPNCHIKSNEWYKTHNKGEE